MTRGACSVEGCGRPVQARGWCAAHYKRWQTTGDVQAGTPIQDHSHPARGHQCRAAGCDREAWATGLCLMHYKQARGRGLDARRVGEPDGYGRYGVLDEEAGRVLCHECGRRLNALGTHLHKIHGMTADEYRDAHGLPRTLPLTAARVSEAISKRASERVGTQAWRRLEAARDPEAAAHSRDADTWDAVSRTHRQK